MHEEWRVEAAVFPQRGRIFCIASAGCTALALATRGYRVTAVDINPEQVRYARARAQGARPQPGIVEERLARGRQVLPWLGIREHDLRQFLELTRPSEQTLFWRERLETGRLRLFLRCALSSIMMKRINSPALANSIPRRFDLVIRRRLARTWANHPNRENPFAWRLLLGCSPLTTESDSPNPEPTADIEFVHADAAEYLDGGAPERFDGFTLSNIFEAAPPAYQARLRASLRRAAAPGAVLVARTLAECTDPAAARWAARDRSPLWGGIEISKINPRRNIAP
jgi:S-adenosylmethionine:diacylglycerol 3-amino-3-carboxypropyl transferase